MTDALYSALEQNISVVNDNVREVRNLVQSVGLQVDAVSREQQDTRERLDGLYEEFQKFVLTDMKQKERQFATTRIIEVRQELDRRFGHHDDTRRHATGILQATDLALVRDETLHNITEELMTSSPRYWLAPALVALAGWITDQRELAERGLEAALARDDAKASLFFALICRRAGRQEPCMVWLERYFQLQNARAMDREVVVMIDAVVNGVFGGGALGACSTVMDGWVAELEEEPGFIDEQRLRWSEALDVMAPDVGAAEYPTLREHSPTWPLLEQALSGARRNEVVHRFFERLFTGDLEVPSQLEVAVDDLLSSLVSNFDDEELPLRREERRLQLIVDEAGDMDSAGERFNVEVDALMEERNFTALLTSAAMHPEQANATRATQRYAVARSKDWIGAGFKDLVGRERAAVPSEAQIDAGSWSGQSRDGGNETELALDLHSHYASRIEAAVAAVRITAATWAVAIGGLLLGFFIARNGGGALAVGGLMMLGAAGYFFFKYRDLDNVRTRVRGELERERDDALRIAQAALAELADLRRELAREDGKARLVHEILEDIVPGQLVLKRADQARTVLA